MTFKRKFDPTEVISSRLPAPNGEIVPVTMFGWYWNALDWIVQKTEIKESDFVGWAIEGAHETRTQFDEALQYVIYRFFQKYNRHMKKWQEKAIDKRRRG